MNVQPQLLTKKPCMMTATHRAAPALATVPFDRPVVSLLGATDGIVSVLGEVP